jgi:DNA (cytosine-5)-methyltransferase 1
MEKNNIKKIKVGSLFSGIGAFEHALARLKVPHEIIFACDIND